MRRATELRQQQAIWRPPSGGHAWEIAWVLVTGSLAPQRIPPRYAGAAEVLTRLPGGFRVVSAVSPFVGDQTETASDSWDRIREKGPTVAVVAFPRTGSRFLAAALSERNPENHVPHLHDATFIGRLRQEGAQVFVPLRNPRDTAISWAIYNDDEPTPARLRARLAAYSSWHRFVAHHTPLGCTAVVRFEDFTQDPAGALAFVDGHEPEPGLRGRACIRVLADNGGVPWRASNLPRHERQALKARFEDLLTHRTVRSALHRAEDLHQGLDGSAALARVPLATYEQANS